ncbi:MAG TPA: ATP-binding protein [Candidatus Dormibacteraeota bacterium]|nr:ATP-binding protein [Candidatus Dormibacteraeota bacterium]
MARRILSVALERRTYLSIAYVLLRLPLFLGFLAVAGLLIRIGPLSIWTLPLIVATASAVWGVVVPERALARRWFGVQLTPLAPERSPYRTWPQRARDLVSNPVMWKSLVYALVEAIVGFPVALLVLVALMIGALGGVALAGTSVLSGLVGVVNAAPVPEFLVLRTLAGAFVCVGILLLTMHAARWLTPLQLRFVRAMLGISQTHLELDAARAEAAAERARAEDADRSRRDLVLNVSHELRNPLATIRAHVETLRDSENVQQSEEDRLRYLEVLNRETDRLSDLVDELLTLASADTGRLELEIATVDAAEVATEVHNAMAPLAWRERHIRLICSAESPLNVRADRRRLAQVLMNLVRNAITHTPEGGMVAMEGTALDSGLVEVAVSDTGPGIEPDEVDRIFERFYRSDESRSRVTGGFGLGLAISREMVNAMGGNIRVDSSSRHGSRFTVTLARA